MRDFVATWRGEWPNTSTWPRVGYISPRRILTVVDFPESLGPSNPKTSPRRTSKSTPSTARALGRPQKSLKTLVRPRTAATTSDEGAGLDIIVKRSEERVAAWSSYRCRPFELVQRAGTARVLRPAAQGAQS